MLHSTYNGSNLHVQARTAFQTSELLLHKTKREKLTVSWSESVKHTFTYQLSYTAFTSLDEISVSSYNYQIHSVEGQWNQGRPTAGQLSVQQNTWKYQNTQHQRNKVMPWKPYANWYQRLILISILICCLQQQNVIICN